MGVEDRGDIRPRMYPWFGICLIRSPAVVMIEARREVVADRNSIVLIPAFRLHALFPRGETAARAVTLLLGGSHLEALGVRPQAALVTDIMISHRVAAHIARLQRPFEGAITTRSLLEQLAARSTPLAAARPRRMVPVRDYLRAHMSDPITTEELARLSALSESHVIRTFHYEFGLPPHAYHMRLRLAAACELLTRGLAVARVACECGFADQSHLSRKFKAVFGLTPAAWAAAPAGSPR